MVREKNARPDAGAHQGLLGPAVEHRQRRGQRGQALDVGAVDRAGDEAGFTSYGPTVKAHANGYQVQSYLPGGDRVALSGTSMAAPQVANLAGKIVAVNPKLKPAEVIRLIVDTGERTADGRRNLIDPKKAIERATALR
jgi:subtilisin family serine protease